MKIDLSKTILDLNRDNILTHISQEQIFEHYFGQPVSLEQKYTNPLRVDNNPGCQFYYNKSGILLFNDFSTTDAPLDCFEFVKQKFDISFYEALLQIDYDFNLGYGLTTNYTPISVKPKPHIIPKKISLLCKPQPLNIRDLHYWNQYGISKATLKKFNVYSVKAVFKNKQPHWIYTISNPIYCYRFKDNKKKCYKPYANKGFKFISSPGISTVYQGYEQLPPKGELLIITKSMKDVMLLYELGYSAIAPNGEGYKICDELITELKSRFDRIIILYDNDEPGIKNAKRLSDAIKCEYIITPDTKDISDYYKKYGKVKTIKLLNILINVEKIN